MITAPIIQAAIPELKWREAISRSINLLAEPSIIAVSAAYSAKPWDIILANAAGAPFAVTLPTAAGNRNKPIRIKRTNTGANAVTIAAAGSENVDGGATLVIGTAYQAFWLISDGSNWWSI